MMMPERIAELRQGYAATSEANKWLNECLDTLEELQVKSGFDDA